MQTNHPTIGLVKSLPGVDPLSSAVAMPHTLEDMRMKVLVVEVGVIRSDNNVILNSAQDNQINQKLLMKLVKTLGAEALACSDGQAAIEMLTKLAVKGNQVDLVFMDLEMCDSILSLFIFILNYFQACP
jgi:hypothetical protein